MKYLKTYEKMMSLDLDIDEQETLMTMAIDQEKISLIEGLFQNGFDPNHITSDYGIPLLLYPLADVTKNLNIEIIRLLISNGADVNLIVNGSPLISDALILYNKRVKNEDYTNKYLEIIRLLIKSGANLSIKNEENENTFDIIENMINWGSFKPRFAKKLLNIIKEEAPEQYGIHITSKKYNI